MWGGRESMTWKITFYDEEEEEEDDDVNDDEEEQEEEDWDGIDDKGC